MPPCLLPPVLWRCQPTTYPATMHTVYFLFFVFLPSFPDYPLCWFATHLTPPIPPIPSIPPIAAWLRLLCLAERDSVGGELVGVVESPPCTCSCHSSNSSRIPCIPCVPCTHCIPYCPSPCCLSRLPCSCTRASTASAGVSVGSGVSGAWIALVTQIEVRALITVPPQGAYLPLAGAAQGPARLAMRVLQVEEQHEGGVLGAPEGVELVVPELAHLQKGMAGVRQRRDYSRVWVGGVGNESCEHAYAAGAGTPQTPL
jgi:hypothetical protein